MLANIHVPVSVSLMSIANVTCMQEAAIAWLRTNAAFVVLIFLLLVWRHLFGLVQLAFLLTATASSTLHLQALVAAPQDRKLVKVLDVLVIVCLNIWALWLLGLPDAAVWRALRFRAPRKPWAVRHLRSRPARLPVCCEGCAWRVQKPPVLLFMFIWSVCSKRLKSLVERGTGHA
jgi:hypothetical protein